MLTSGPTGGRSGTQVTPTIDENDPLVNFILDEAVAELNALLDQGHDGRHHSLPIK